MIVNEAKEPTLQEVLSRVVIFKDAELDTDLKNTPA
jgi:hypothetical protein